MSYRSSLSRTLSTALLLSLSALTLKAQTTGATPDVPHTISYQGMLANSSDKAPLPDGNYQVTVSLYSDPNGANPIWQDSYSTPVNGGIFNLYLGSGTRQLPPSIVLNTPLWIGTSVNGGEEMRPLTPLSASPYALNVSDKAITTNKLADKAVTAEKLGTDYVSELRVNGEKVTGQGTVLNIQGTPSVPISYDATTQSLMIGKLHTAGDREKGTNSLVGNNIVWSVNGDGWDIGAGIGYTPAVGDWIGTISGTDFLVEVNSIQVMNYQVSTWGPVMNIVGGDVANVINPATVQGSIIAEGIGNTISNGDHHAISGGQDNSIGAGAQNVIGGGARNTINNGDQNVISGGIRNTIAPSGAAVTYGTIGGGENNSVDASLATVGGGGSNSVTQPEGTIAGGHKNNVRAYVGAITGGHDNYILSGGDAGFIGAGRSNQVDARSGAVAGGDNNWVRSGADHSFIGAGNSNIIDAGMSAIGGGDNNQIQTAADHAFIGGGNTNIINGGYAAIGGGDNNNITNVSDHGFIGGGSGNVINNGGGGFSNYSAIGGGLTNLVEGQYSTISGGQLNNIGANTPWGTIGGGSNNRIAANSFMATIGGGGGHFIDAPEATIAGGHRNQVHAYVSVVAGGHDNYIWQNSTHAAIGGGLLNSIGVNGGAPIASHSAIAGGQQNAIGVLGGGTADHSVIGGGQSNVIGNGGGGNSDHSTIGGGSNNRLESPISFIGGGENNNIGPNIALATIGGGERNTILAPEGAIVGGRDNVISNNATEAFIGGGRRNRIDDQFGTIGGGISNGISFAAPFASIGGGQENNATGSHTTIPGGDRLTTAQSYAQSAMGFFNAQRGSMPVRPTAAQVAASNDPLFMIGNGDINAGVSSNAFEVSYNGHSSVYGVNGSGTVAPSITGGTFVDNVIYAWADVPAAGAIGPVIPNSDFGVASITNLGPGVYDVAITVTDQTTSSAITLTNASITATIVDNKGDFGCTSITTTQMGYPGPNRFIIRTYANKDCKPVNLPFMFKVTGRP